VAGSRAELIPLSRRKHSGKEKAKSSPTTNGPAAFSPSAMTASMAARRLRISRTSGQLAVAGMSEGKRRRADGS
jgi:hypothetical protein